MAEDELDVVVVASAPPPSPLLDEVSGPVVVVLLLGAKPEAVPVTACPPVLSVQPAAQPASAPTTPATFFHRRAMPPSSQGGRLVAKGAAR